MHVSVVIDTLRAHGTMSAAAVAEEGCWAIAFLALGNAANCAALGAAGACECEEPYF